MALNIVAISGNLARDAEVRQAGSTSVANLTVAVNDRRRNKQTGEWEDVPQWVDCTLLGTRAEKLAPYLTKGTKVSIQGKLHYSSWEKDGQKRSKLDVTIDELEFMSSRNGQPQQQGGYQQPAQQRYQPRQQPAQQHYAQPQQQAFDGSIPF